MRPEDRDKILDRLFQCGNTIRECNSFEIIFIKESCLLIAENMTRADDLLTRQCVTALTFAWRIRRACKGMQPEFMESCYAGRQIQQRS